MLGNPNLRDTAKESTNAFTQIQGNSPTKLSPKKKHFPINFIQVIKKHFRFYLPLAISVTLSSLCVDCPFPVSAFIFLALTANIPILFIVIPQCIIISPIHCTGYTPLFKTLHNREDNPLT